ncbi:MAG TPA: hypothetical protein VNI84_14455 [Pyrinomonadaceae bacterium]|nr:hypothetical protein [Pyrinomonadaceae bacterium]
MYTTPDITVKTLRQTELQQRIFELVKAFNEQNDAKVESVRVQYDERAPNAKMLLGVKVEIAD